MARPKSGNARSTEARHRLRYANKGSVGRRHRQSAVGETELTELELPTTLFGIPIKWYGDNEELKKEFSREIWKFKPFKWMGY
jgi:hypothetical protein